MDSLAELLQKPNALEDGSVKKAVEDILASHVAANIFRAVELICDEKVMLSVSKEMMKVVVAGMDSFDDIAAMNEFEQKIVQCTLPRQSAYEDVLSLVYEKAAAKYEACGRKKEAAEELVKLYDCINDSHNVADSRSIQKSPEYLRRRVDLCVHATTLLAETGDVEGANRLLMRVSDKVSELPAGDNSILNYKKLYAKLFDLRHDFIHAAQKYIELVRLFNLSPEEKIECLTCCARCVILCDAGVERSSVLSIMLKNEQTASIACYPYLKKIHKQQILRPDDVAALQGMLLDHQKNPLRNEKAPLVRAVMLHNLFSAANIYTSIRLENLARLLGTDVEEAEIIASDMIRQNRINAKIDQVEGLLCFNNQQDLLAVWDSHIDDMCNAANDAADMITLKDEMK